MKIRGTAALRYCSRVAEEGLDVEVPEDLRPTYTTLAGPLTMRSAPPVLEVAANKIYTDILTPFITPSRMLLGFQVLKQFDLALLRDRAFFLNVERKS